ncbi:hypothetical protein HOC37_06615 [bacterium]|jgi:hypothetical protein|nr:hypothetical protein [bacterium]MBT4552633.1 hypothetical protein [bacterium]
MKRKVLFNILFFVLLVSLVYAVTTNSPSPYVTFSSTDTAITNQAGFTTVLGAGLQLNDANIAQTYADINNRYSPFYFLNMNLDANAQSVAYAANTALPGTLVLTINKILGGNNTVTQGNTVETWAAGPFAFAPAYLANITGQDTPNYSYFRIRDINFTFTIGANTGQLVNNVTYAQTGAAGGGAGANDYMVLGWQNATPAQSAAPYLINTYPNAFALNIRYPSFVNFTGITTKFGIEIFGLNCPTFITTLFFTVANDGNNTATPVAGTNVVYQRNNLFLNILFDYVQAPAPINGDLGFFQINPVNNDDIYAFYHVFRWGDTYATPTQTRFSGAFYQATGTTAQAATDFTNFAVYFSGLQLPNTAAPALVWQ